MPAAATHARAAGGERGSNARADARRMPGRAATARAGARRPGQRSRHARVRGSYGGTLEEQCRQWIEEVTGEALEWDEGAEHGALWGALKSGVALCALLNRLAPGTVKRVSASEMPFPQRENVQAFCDGCKALGVPPQDGFTTVDLFEGECSARPRGTGRRARPRVLGRPQPAPAPGPAGRPAGSSLR